MVTIVTGKINSGKTTFLENLYLQNQKGDGFIARKHFLNGDIYRFTLVQLSNKNTYPWMIHEKFYQNEFEKFEKFGPYYLNLETLELITPIYDNLVNLGVSPIYLDEVGQLEINKGGYYKILKNILRKNVDLVFTTRPEFVKSLVEIFEISDYQISRV